MCYSWRLCHYVWVFRCCVYTLCTIRDLLEALCTSPSAVIGKCNKLRLIILTVYLRHFCKYLFDPLSDERTGQFVDEVCMILYGSYTYAIFIRTTEFHSQCIVLISFWMVGSLMYSTYRPCARSLQRTIYLTPWGDLCGDYANTSFADDTVCEPKVHRRDCAKNLNWPLYDP